MTLWLITFGVALSGWLGAYILGRSDGKHAQREAILNSQIKAAERIRDVQATAPVNSDALLDSLRDNSRKL